MLVNVHTDGEGQNFIEQYLRVEKYNTKLTKEHYLEKNDVAAVEILKINFKIRSQLTFL